MAELTSELTGPALDWAVAKCLYTDRRVELTEGKTGVRVLRRPEYDGSAHSHWFCFFGSDNWAQGGPIVEREFIEIRPGSFIGSKECPRLWAAWAQDRHGNKQHGKTGPTPLIAAMRCFVASRLGDEVDVPEELSRQSGNKEKP